jgi:cytochrome c oxidase assembly protein subunit 15
MSGKGMSGKGMSGKGMSGKGAGTPPRAARSGPLLSPRLLTGFAAASLVASVAIVVTGGAVRLSGSGLGCPTWPRCTETSLTPTGASHLHGIIEFTNRQLTFVVSAIVLGTLVLALRQHWQVRLAVLLAASIPAQAVLGGITVLTHLNPWTVAAHFLLSMAIIAVAFTMWWRLSQVPSEPLRRAAAGGIGGVRVSRLAAGGIGGVRVSRPAAGVVLAVAGLTLAAGTVVTGTGPHAGDQGATNRIHLAPADAAQLHADLVMLLIGLTIGLLAVCQLSAGRRAVAGCAALLGVELAQGLVGFVQYFTGVPAVLVGVHMLGACLVWLAALRTYALCGIQQGDARPPSSDTTAREDSDLVRSFTEE